MARPRQVPPWCGWGQSWTLCLSYRSVGRPTEREDGQDERGLAPVSLTGCCGRTLAIADRLPHDLAFPVVDGNRRAVEEAGGIGDEPLPLGEGEVDGGTVLAVQPQDQVPAAGDLRLVGAGLDLAPGADRLTTVRETLELFGRKKAK